MLTTTISNVLQQYAWPELNQSPWELVDKGYEKFFDFSFPWYTDSDNGASKVDFMKNYLHRYYMNEIGQETLNLHKQMLYSRLSLNMPYYKQMYETMLNEQGIDMTGNLDYTMTGEDSGNYNNTENRDMTDNTEGAYQDSNTTNTDANNQAINSDNPQVNFSGTDYASDMTRGQTEQNVTGSANGTNETDKTVQENKTGSGNNASSTERVYKGRNGAFPADVIEKWREIVYNINKEIIDSCDSLFLGVLV